ncbi:MAG: flagellar hook-length control protein FliK, partial [Firmicutes bacterium]|nr:flagellar hook-length control protein FliK [Bacillota bacterium]
LQEVVKPYRDIPVTKNEIINQVVEKAKVVISGEKSEMMMDLKPDSLGKLSLKVVTERGMVVAQFVAESQQVKQVLEANMQLLKDTLERQGLSVQQFSVSVGQDNPRSFEEGRRFEEGARPGEGRITSARYGRIPAADVLEKQQMMSGYGYGWNGSKIDLTA